jgi:hypothetical protein
MPALPLHSTVQPTEGAPLEFRRFSDLETIPPEPDWLWRGYLARGSVTMLAGHAFEGKSTLVGALLKAIEGGADFLGQRTRKATALLVSEEDRASIRARAGLLGLSRLQSEYVSRNGGVYAVEWRELIDRVTEQALGAGHALLVIDTLPGLAGLQHEQENDAGAIGERLRELQKAAGKGLAVLFLHHVNQQGRPRGSSAFRGVVDTSILFSRPQKGKRIQLKAESRFGESTPPLLRGALVQTADGWIYEAGETASAKSGVNERQQGTDQLLWKTLLDAPLEGLTYRQLGLVDGLSEDIAKKRLPSWWKAGRVEPKGAGSKGDPYRWVANRARFGAVPSRL